MTDLIGTLHNRFDATPPMLLPRSLSTSPQNGESNANRAGVYFETTLAGRPGVRDCCDSGIALPAETGRETT
jgi:hypothetical protein